MNSGISWEEVKEVANVLGISAQGVSNSLYDLARSGEIERRHLENTQFLKEIAHGFENPQEEQKNDVTHLQKRRRHRPPKRPSRCGGGAVMLAGRKQDFKNWIRYGRA